MVLESKYGSPKIVNDGVTIAREVELEDPVENIGCKLVRQVSWEKRYTSRMVVQILSRAKPSVSLPLGVCCKEVNICEVS